VPAPFVVPPVIVAQGTREDFSGHRVSCYALRPTHRRASSAVAEFTSVASPTKVGGIPAQEILVLVREQLWKFSGSPAACDGVHDKTDVDEPLLQTIDQLLVRQFGVGVCSRHGLIGRARGTILAFALRGCGVPGRVGWCNRAVGPAFSERLLGPRVRAPSAAKSEPATELQDDRHAACRMFGNGDARF
jgi:hypothetical protein